MALIVKPYTFSAGQIIIASQHNANFDTIITDYNGNIDNDNIATGAAIVYAKLDLATSIINNDISATAAIVDTKLAQIATAGKVSATALTNLANISASGGTFPLTVIPVIPGSRLTTFSTVPSGAGIVPTINLGSGSTSGATFLRGDGVWTTVTTSQANLNGTANQVLVTGGTNAVMVATTLSLPQDIGTGSDVQFSKVSATNFAGALSASYITSFASAQSSAGIFPAINLGSGATSSTVVLKGNGTWASVGTSLTGSIEYIIDGGGSVITTGSKGYIEIPFACTLTSAIALANTSCSVSIDIKKCAYTSFPTFASIVSSAPLAMATTQNTLDTTLTGWTTAITAGDLMEFLVSGCTGASRLTVSLKYNR
jgi:hypothetical protein